MTNEIQGDGKGQGSLVCCNPGGRQELDTTERQSHHHHLPTRYLIFTKGNVLRIISPMEKPVKHTGNQVIEMSINLTGRK